jgi:flagellar motor switch protein FliN/FliY
MSLEPRQLENLKSVTARLSGHLAETLSQLLNDNISIVVNNPIEALSLGGQANINETQILTVIELDAKNLGPVYLYSKPNLVAQIANMMMGEPGGKDNLDEVKIDAFNSAIKEAFSDLTLKVKISRITNVSSLVLDPNQPESLAIPGYQEDDRIGLNIGLKTSSASSSNAIIELSEELANLLLKAVSGDSRKEEAILGTNFAEIKDMHDPSTIDEKHNLDLLMDIRMGLIVELGRAEMHLKDILKLTKGSIIELDRLSGEAVDLFVNNKLIARGEVVVIDDNFGLRITQLAGNNVTPSDLGLVGADNE